MVTLHTAALAGIVLLHLVFTAHSAPAASSHPVKSRDTDEDPSLKVKLARIHELLSQLDSEASDGEEESTTGTSAAAQPGKAEAQEKEMRSLGREDREKFRSTAARLPKHSSYKVPVPPKPVSPTEDSMQMLAQALAQLRMSQAEDTGSDGEKMGTRYNPRRKANSEAQEGFDKEEAGRELEQTIAEALARLQEEDEPQRKPVRPPPSSLNSFHEEAIHMVESRLMRDLALGDRLGLSVDELIQDLEEQELREETLQKLENSLAALVADRDE